MKNRNLLALVLTGAMCLSMLAGCSSPTTGASSGAAAPDATATTTDTATTDTAAATTDTASSGTGTTLTIGLDADIVKLDPAFSYDWSTSPVLVNVTEGILDYDLEVSSQLNCTLAESWEQVDTLTYVYNIRDDIVFSDGTPMTMEDVMFCMERVMDPETGSYLSWMFDSVESLEQTDEWQFTVTLSNPDANWQYVLGTHAGHVYSKAHYEAAGDSFGTSEGGIIGTGPYKYVSWQNGTEILLTRNENYRDNENVYYDNLDFKVITDSTTLATALQTGGVDVCMTPPADLLDLLKADENLTVTTFDGFGINYLAFNCEKEPLNNVLVREAIYYALNTESIQVNLMGDAATHAGSLPNSEAMYTFDADRWVEYEATLPGNVYDPEKAIELLAEAGYADGFDLELCTSSTNIATSVGLAIQSDLAAVGINVTINKVSSDEHTNIQFGGVMGDDGYRAYDMIFAGWQADYPDPAGNIYPLYQGGNSSNAAVYNNETVTDLILQQTAETDPSVRTDLMFEIMDIVVDEFPYVNVYYPTKDLVTSNNIGGIVMTPNWSWNLNLKDAYPLS